jgi:hypothetical protein
MLTSSIVRRHNHANAINFIGLQFDGTSFPAVLSCPFCGENTLYAFDYTVREDIWFNCTSCSGHGNIITLAAQIWKTDVPTAIDKLLNSGLTHGGHSEDIVDLLKLNNRQRAAEIFWAAASSQAWTHADDTILHRYREFGISREIPCDGLVGVATGEQVADFCAAIPRAWPRHMRATQPATILPYYDLPNHFSGFLMIQCGREMETKQAFIPLQGPGSIRNDAGYFMLDHALLPPNDTMKDTLFIVDDPMWALQAHTVQLRHDTPPLPICVGYYGREAVSNGTSLHNFKQTKKLFYGAAVTSEIVSQAANARGYVCVPRAEGTLINPSPLRTMRRLSAIHKSAVTWQQALDDVINNAEPMAATSFAAKLTIPRDKLQHFLRSKTQLPEASILEIIARSTPCHVVELGKNFGSLDVMERDDGWYTPSGLCITTCIPVIKQIVYTQDGGKYYDGYVKKQNTIVEFFAAAAVIEKIGLLTYSEQLLAGKNLMVISATRWNKRAINVALKLHPPTVVTVSDALGWDDSAREFRFSAYSIKNDGTVMPLPCPQLQSDKKFDFPEPSTAAPTSIKAFLTQSHENAFTWTIVAAVLNNFIAPIMNVHTTGVVIRADGYPAAIECGKALSCDIAEMDLSTNDINSRVACSLKTLPHMTMFTAKDQPDIALRGLVVKGPQHPIFLGLSEQSIPAVLSFNWAAISPAGIPAAGIDYSVLRYVIPTYIQRLLRQRIGFTATGPKLLLTILRDLHKWLEETYGATFNIHAAEAGLLLPDNAHEALMRELNDAVCAGIIDVLPRHRRGNQSQNYILRDNENWWLNRRAVDSYLVKTGIAPNWTALLNCLTKQGVFNGEEDVNHSQWFLVDKKWCDKFWSDYEEKSVG